MSINYSLPRHPALRLFTCVRCRDVRVDKSPGLLPWEVGSLHGDPSLWNVGPTPALESG